ncbi:MAG: hypothetical protein ACNA7U_05690 [Candidatus Izemoplasmataceae bacterium]
MKNTMTKWLIRLNEMDQVVIKPKEVSKHAPINRVLDEVGFYALDSMTVNGVDYMVVFKPEELYTKKTIILVSRIEKSNEGERLIDMSNEDRDNINFIANHYLLNINTLIN